MTITTDPTYPVAGEEVTLSATSTTGDTLAYSITSVPPQSELETGLLLLPNSTDPRGVIQAASADLTTDSFTPDVAGEYGVMAFDLARIPGIVQHAGDGNVERVVLKATQTGTIHVGVYMDLPIVTTQGHGATLRVTVVDETVRAAELVESTTELARVAAEQSAVESALAALVGVAVNSIGNTLATDVNDLLSNYEAHRSRTAGSAHAAADTTNVAATTSANSTTGALHVVNDLRDTIMGHLRDSPAPGSGGWHTVDDLLNWPIAQPGNTHAAATVVLAELRERVYERHRVQVATPAVHGGADGTNVLSAPTVLDDAIVAYLDAVAEQSPTAPAGEVEGAQDLAHRHGFGPVT